VRKGDGKKKMRRMEGKEKRRKDEKTKRRKDEKTKRRKDEKTKRRKEIGSYSSAFIWSIPSEN
jgi:hypothetical protein